MKFWLFALLIVIIAPIVTAFEFGDQVSAQDQATFNEILKPVLKIYNFVKYIATVLAALVLLFAGITYISGGSDPKKRDQAKSMATYVFVGLIVIWATPLIVNFVVL